MYIINGRYLEGEGLITKQRVECSRGCGLFSQVPLWVYFGVVQFKTWNDAHRQLALSTHVGGSLPTTPLLLTVHCALCLSLLSRWCAGKVVRKMSLCEA